MNYRSGAINIGNVFSHITLKKGVCDFPDVVWFFFYNLLKFDIVNADVPFYKRGHNLETEAKSNKARHAFSNALSLNMAADFQLIPSEDARKRTKQTSTYSGAKTSRSVIVGRTKYQGVKKGLYVNCCDFFYAEDFVSRIGIMFITFRPLRSPDIY